MELLSSLLLLKFFFSLFSPHLRNLSRMTRRAEMLPLGSGPFLMVAGAGVGSGGEKGEIQSLSPCPPVFCSYCVFRHCTPSRPEVCGSCLLQCSQHLQPSAQWGREGQGEYEARPVAPQVCCRNPGYQEPLSLTVLPDTPGLCGFMNSYP